MRALIITADEFEDIELFVPYYRLLEEGVGVDIAAKEPGRLLGKHAYAVMATKATSTIHPSDYGVLILPGGKAPARVRKDPAALQITRSFFEEGKPVAAICHGPQILVSAGVIKGRRATCYRTVAKELVAAGAKYEDQPVIVDRNLVTSREPADLPAFMQAVMPLVRDAKRFDRVVAGASASDY